MNWKKIAGNALGAFLIALPASAVIVGTTPYEKGLYAVANACIAAALSGLLQLKEQLDAEGASPPKINTWLMF